MEDATEAGHQWIVGRHYDTWRISVTNPKNVNQWGIVNYLGRWVVQPQYAMIRQFSGEHNYIYTQALKGGRWGNIDRNGNVISDFIFSREEDCVYALSQIEHGRDIDGWRLPEMRTDTNLWGWVKADGSWAIQPTFLEVSRFPNDTGLFATAKCENGLWASIHEDGRLLSKPVFTLSSEAAKAGKEWDDNQKGIEEAELGHWLYPIQEPKTGHWGYVDFEEGPVALDLFAGTGSITLELLSRGCSRVVSVEKDPLHYNFICKFIEKLQDTAALPLRGDVFKYLERCHEKFDFIFADPPYTLSELPDLPNLVMGQRVLKEDGLFVLEHGKTYDFTQHPNFVAHRAYGSVNFSFFKPKEA